MAIRLGLLGILAATVALSGCALKSDVRRVETELAAIKAESAARDSATAARLAELIEHRRMREQRILEAWVSGRRDPAEILEVAYDEIPEIVRPLAERQVLAHLERLKAHGSLNGRR